LWRELLNVVYRKAYFQRYDYGAWRVNRVVKRKLRGIKDPFFLFINYMEPHLEYGPPKFAAEYVNQQEGIPNQNPWEYIFGINSMSQSDFGQLRKLYHAELKYVDSRLGSILEYLRKIGQYEKSMIIVTSDHGENIGDHGLMDHQYCLYNTLLHVPMIVKYPEQTERRCVESLVSTLDILPTIRDVLDMHADELLDGVPLDEAEVMSDRHIISEYLSPTPTVESVSENYPGASEEAMKLVNRSIRSIQNSKAKYIEYSDGQKEYFDLTSDKKEKNNLFDDTEQCDIEYMHSRLHSEAGILIRPESDVEIRARDHTRQILEDLGYLH
jgi:arylsulfatase A-like enzyme